MIIEIPDEEVNAYVTKAAIQALQTYKFKQKMEEIIEERVRRHAESVTPEHLEEIWFSACIERLSRWSAPGFDTYIRGIKKAIEKHEVPK